MLMVATPARNIKETSTAATPPVHRTALSRSNPSSKKLSAMVCPPLTILIRSSRESKSATFRQAKRHPTAVDLSLTPKFHAEGACTWFFLYLLGFVPGCTWRVEYYRSVERPTELATKRLKPCGRSHSEHYSVPSPPWRWAPGQPWMQTNEPVTVQECMGVRNARDEQIEQGQSEVYFALAPGGTIYFSLSLSGGPSAAGEREGRGRGGKSLEKGAALGLVI
ncbi:hypothetical protein BKA64DRAFT_647058 [Cadophora sp. MPI-SDFR-AT-0126]|nr:hypothetical protein BKA64DRAFT_647058 [Leotiomycetes sp. MPI-SDFR-AT-0126]